MFKKSTLGIGGLGLVGLLFIAIMLLANLLLRGAKTRYLSPAQVRELMQ